MTSSAQTIEPQTFEVSNVPMALGLSKLVSAYLERRPERPRSPGFHPSESAYMCPVLERFVDFANDDLCSGDPAKIEAAMNFRRAVLESKRFSSNLKLEFLVGDAIHELVVQYHLGVLGFLWGVWECPECGSRTEAGFMPRTQILDVRGQPMHEAAPCQACWGRNHRHDAPWRYREPAMGDTALAAELGISGNMDGDLRFYRDGRWFRYILEVKSINSAGYSGKRGFPLPKPEHILQASIYAYLKGVQWLHFIYVCKDQVSEWKEIVVPVDLEAVSRYKGRIDSVLKARAVGQLPLHARICSDPRDERARKCPAVSACFGCSAPDDQWTVRSGR
jgi:hypothetical protein